MFFKDLPIEKRMEKIRDIGFQYFEIWSWWDKDVDALLNALKKNQIELAACCTHFIPLVLPEKRKEYIDGLEATVKTCRKLSCNMIISQVGNEVPGKDRNVQKESIIAGLKEASVILERNNITLVVEPLNTLYDHQGYFLSRSDEAAEIIGKVSSANVKMLFDIYHQQISEGNVINNIQRYIQYIGHFHMADVPGRHEPGTGEINYKNIFRRIEELAYHGHVGIELFPSDKNNHYGILKEIKDSFRERKR